MHARGNWRLQHVDYDNAPHAHHAALNLTAGGWFLWRGWIAFSRAFLANRHRTWCALLRRVVAGAADHQCHLLRCPQIGRTPRYRHRAGADHLVSFRGKFSGRALPIITNWPGRSFWEAFCRSQSYIARRAPPATATTAPPSFSPVSPVDSCSGPIPPSGCRCWRPRARRSRSNPALGRQQRNQARDVMARLGLGGRDHRDHRLPL